MKNIIFLMLLLPSLAFAIKPVSLGQVSQVANATDFTCPAVAGFQIPPFCYQRLVTFFGDNSDNPVTICYIAPNSAAPAINAPISLKLFLPAADGSGPLPYTITPGIVSCP